MLNDEKLLDKPTIIRVSNDELYIAEPINNKIKVFDVKKSIDQNH